MFRCKASVVGWSGLMRTTGCQEMTMAAFLDVHARINLECDSQLVLPFLYPEEQMSGLDIAFVVRFSDLAPNDDTEGSSEALPGALCGPGDQGLWHGSTKEDQGSWSQAQPLLLTTWTLHQSHRELPAEISGYLMDWPRMKHPDGVMEIALKIDDRNIDFLSEKLVQALKDVKRLALEMAEAIKEVKQRRIQQVYENCLYLLFDDILALIIIIIEQTLKTEPELKSLLCSKSFTYGVEGELGKKKAVNGCNEDVK
ncbi:hypothetical protein BG003_010362 [Podila horticola]|nr:hypothetical protein BG003_010362 [Podila horticola]